MPIVALGVTDSEEEIVALAEAGTAALVFAEQPAELIMTAVEEAAAGRVQGSARVASILQQRLAEIAHVSPTAASGSLLTPRQLEILGLIGEGMTAKEIARSLVVAPRTVRNHIQHIYTALSVHRRSEAVAWLRTAVVPNTRAKTPVENE
jgi:DNA-binding NarL/FixJ family response regulator